MHRHVATLLGSAWVGQLSFPEGSATPWLVGVAVLGLVALLFALALVSRRQERRHLRAIVDAVEDIRSGNLTRRIEVPPHSPVAYVASAVNRLGDDLASRTRDAQISEGRLRTLLEAARDWALVVTDLDGDIRSFSTTASDLFGLEEEEAQSRPVSVLFEERSFAEILPKLARKSFRERGVSGRVLMQRKDGTTFPAEISVRSVHAAKDASAGFLLLIKDIRTQVRLEEDLRESEVRYRALFENLGEAAVVLQEGRVVLANRAMADLCGTAASGLEGRPLTDWVGTRDLMVVQERLAALEAVEAGVEEMRFSLLGADRKRAAQVRFRAVAVRLGARPAVLGSIHDETQERLVEGELRRNEGRLDAVLEATSDGILVVDDGPGGGVARVTNRAFLAMFGLTEHQVLGSSEGDLLRLLRERGEGAETVAAFLASATRGTRVERVVLGQNPPRVLELHAASLGGVGGALLGRVLACRDITDQSAFEKRLEANAEALRKSKADLEQSFARLKAVQEQVALRVIEEENLNRELKTLSEMKTNLLANVSHELQTPLVSIRGYTEMILRERLGSINDEQRKGLALSLKNIDRLISMIDGLLAFTRSPHEATELALGTFPLASVVQEAVELLAEKAGERRVEISARFSEPEVTVQADRGKILQVFVNLLANGIKFNREGGRVEVVVGPGKPGFVAVQVKDTGVGIPRDEVERIFERYYRGRTAGGEEGSGIGLSLVRNILRLHGCSIQVDSREGEGSTFSLTLPAAGSRPHGGTTDPEPSANAADGSAPERPGIRPRFRIIRPPAGRE